jgi:hypothetical protein
LKIKDFLKLTLMHCMDVSVFLEFDREHEWKFIFWSFKFLNFYYG